ncbi:MULTISPECIES: chemotaxis protein CheX [unclassified Herbaspirillum]|uniref:chemotaxis protein CheX n=1 Tax=unclassified Herbaspirillum TaxID=2624150 RepID=UPI000E2F035C|nr:MULTISPECIES: chemotaxis protein CheX [unclassified Herbaspirillum]RFB73876.1 chemotaxis protein CheC [Herbaspirillum sp. 3R-3a1]TFI10312.1 chemotaxis protein CheC [Herbaspirillum sp. 3R11]TFI16216.1 chemotaxis protein CheC [Herbaspirillum sp. 3R-11]TFI23584.1 chemotaxis protein CheC [Herbaspirillum sp. 3C11]
MKAKVLSEIQIDALTEVFNVGAGRAALSLSEIVGEEVMLSVPSIEVLKAEDVNSRVLTLKDDKFATVSQLFSGPFEAEAVLLFTENYALEIVRDMMGSQMSIEDLAEFEQEAMCELGNIILNACLSAMADMLGISLNSSLPTYAMSSPDEITARLADKRDEENGEDDDNDGSYVLVLHIDLVLEKHHTEGHLIFLLSSTSLSKLISHIQQYLNNIL